MKEIDKKETVNNQDLTPNGAWLHFNFKTFARASFIILLYNEKLLEVRTMEKVKLLDKGIIELPRKVREKFGLEKGTEFDLFFDSETIYLKRVFKSLKEKPFSEVVRPFREMAKKEKLRSIDVAEEINKYRKKG